jgi:hypothetical protein
MLLSLYSKPISLNMKKYHVSINGKQSGPHSIEEVKAMNLSDRDLIWNENLPTWFNATEFSDLKELVKKHRPHCQIKYSKNQKLLLKLY